MYSNSSYSPETPNLGQIRRFLEPCDLEIWRMTLKNNREPLLCCFQLCAWFHCHMWIQTGVRVRKRLSWVLTSVTLTFDLWPWSFAWTSLLTMVITSENFMMIRWWEHGEKGVTDRRTDGRTDRRTDIRTDWTSHKAAWSQLTPCYWQICVTLHQIFRNVSFMQNAALCYALTSVEWCRPTDDIGTIGTGYGKYRKYWEAIISTCICNRDLFQKRFFT